MLWPTTPSASLRCVEQLGKSPAADSARTRKPPRTKMRTLIVIRFARACVTSTKLCRRRHTHTQLNPQLTHCVAGSQTNKLPRAQTSQTQPSLLFRCAVRILSRVSCTVRSFAWHAIKVQPFRDASSNCTTAVAIVAAGSLFPCVGEHNNTAANDTRPTMAPATTKLSRHVMLDVLRLCDAPTTTPTPTHHFQPHTYKVTGARRARTKFRHTVSQLVSLPAMP